MSDRIEIPRPTVKRLSLYLREVERRIAAGSVTISSRQIGEALSIADTQIRKDLGHFGQIGRSGIGYQARDLARTLRRILGLDRSWSTVLVGAGNIGQALLAYPPFALRGFQILAAFDQSPAIVGKTFEGILVRGMGELESFVREQDIHLGLVAVPADAAQEVANRLVQYGVRGILNFAPTRLDVAAGVVSVDLSRSLELLAFQVSQGLLGEVALDD